MSGRIFQLNVSPGGVPKLPIREARVDQLGLAGDGHAHPKIHGGPERAVCLLALELIQQFQAEGHPIWPGSTGENVTFSGLDYTSFVPGMRLALGDEVQRAGVERYGATDHEVPMRACASIGGRRRRPKGA